MTVSSEVSDISYAGDDVTVAFEIPFGFLSNSDIVVSSRDADGDTTPLSTGFAITGAGTGSGTCTFTTAPVSGVTIVIERAPQIHQPMDLVSNDRFPAETVEQSFDRQTFISQYVRRLIERCLQVPAGDLSVGGAVVLPAASTRKGKVLLFDETTGEPSVLAVADISGIATALTSTLIATTLDSLVRSAAEIAASVTPSNYAYPVGDLRRYGAVGDGSTNDSVAWQSAITLGLAIIPAGFSFKILTGATKTGRVTIRGFGPTSKLLCDSTVVTITDGTDSEVSNFRMENITAPYIITRNTTTWVATGSTSNGPGYQPTVNDSDVWAGLTAGQQSQNIGPRIFFQGDATGITVEKITGRFVQIELYDARDSTIRDCHIRGGKGGVGAIVFWNINEQDGRGNVVDNCFVEYASFCGVVFSRNYNGRATNIIANDCGESGVKFWKGADLTADDRCYNMTVDTVKSNRCYYDGVDLCGDIPLDDTLRTSHVISNIEVFGCHGTGMNIDGQGHALANLKFWLNGNRGWWGNTANSIGTNIVLIGNNALDDDNFAEMSEEGAGNKFIGIHVVSESARGHYAIYAPGQNSFIGVRSTGRPLFFGNIGSITASLIDVVDDKTGADRLHNASVSEYPKGLDERGITMWPRRSTATVPAGAVTGSLDDATGGAEHGSVNGYVARSGAITRALKLAADGTRNVPYAIVSAPSSAPASASQDNGTVVFWLDEAGNNIKFQVKESGGTVLTGTLAVS